MSGVTTGRTLDAWAYATTLSSASSAPATPIENAYVESFNGNVVMNV